MKKIVAVLAALALTPLAAACGDNAQEELAEQELESAEDITEERADVAEEMGNEAAEEALDAEADAYGEAADNVDMPAADETM